MNLIKWPKKLTMNALRDHGFYNTYSMLKDGEPAINYYSGSRFSPRGVRLWAKNYSLNPVISSSFDRGIYFGVSFGPGAFAARKQHAIEAAAARATNLGLCGVWDQWTRTPDGDYVPAYVIARVEQKIREDKAAASKDEVPKS